MQPQARNHLIFFLAVLLLFSGYFLLKPHLFPERPVAEAPPGQKEKEKEKEGKEPRRGGDEPVRLASLPKPTPDDEVQALTLGSDDRESGFELRVQLDPLAGGVRSVLLNKFRAANVDGRPTGDMLELVPGELNRQTPAFSFYSFDVEDPNAERPLDTLGRVRWEVVRKEGGEWKEVKDLKQAVVQTSDDGQVKQQISFRRTTQGVTVVRTYSLAERQYHIGLEVELSRPKAPSDAAKEKRAIRFRYQLAGARGLPVEGKWYTSIFRNAYIGTETAGHKAFRDLQDLRQLSSWGGGNPVDRAEDRFIRFAGIGVQYFASVIVVDDQQEDQKFIRRARPTLETAVVRGRLRSKRADRLVIGSDDGRTPEETVYVPAALRDEAAAVEVGQPVAVIFESLSYDPVLKETPRVATAIRTGTAAEATHALWEDDITIRVNTEPVDLNPGDAVTHKYLLYHGPVKPSLLRHLRGEAKVDLALVDRYADDLNLNTMTDYPMPGFFGAVGSYTGFSTLVIYCTNIIHRVLGWLTYVIPSYGLCILVLTVLVRGMMFPLSRKQALMGLKMQALAPEIKKLSEKYKDDQQARGQAVMELYRKHGVNPLGSCWVMLLQMPVFMGLYYALQESIQFRLAPFWPTWIVNLAAPDMMIYWTRNIPMISSDASYGGMLYLGPYLNLLPIVAVALMMVQQKMMTPPPADEQQEMQQKMMKYMMIVMCIMFYKVAAGLCIYFIASSLWGFAERKLLPKAKKAAEAADDAADAPASPTQVTARPAGITTRPAGVTTGKKPGRNKRKDRGGKGRPSEPEGTPSRLGQLRQQISDWWNDVLEQARKK